MSKSNLADLAKLKKLIKICLRMPQILVSAAMKLAEYSNEEIAILSLRRFIQHALPGGSLKGLRVHVARDVPPLPAPPDRTKQHQHCVNPNAIIGIKYTPSIHHPYARDVTRALDVVGITPPPVLPHQPSANMVMPDKKLALSVTTATKKRKLYNQNYYLKRRSHLFIATANIATPHLATTTTTLETAASAISSANPWAFCADGTVRTPVASKMAKLQ